MHPSKKRRLEGPRPIEVSVGYSGMVKVPLPPSTTISETLDIFKGSRPDGRFSISLGEDGDGKIIKVCGNDTVGALAERFGVESLNILYFHRFGPLRGLGWSATDVSFPQYGVHFPLSRRLGCLCGDCDRKAREVHFSVKVSDVPTVRVDQDTLVFFVRCGQSAAAFKLESAYFFPHYDSEANHLHTRFPKVLTDIVTAYAQFTPETLDMKMERKRVVKPLNTKRNAHGWIITFPRPASSALYTLCLEDIHDRVNFFTVNFVV